MTFAPKDVTPVDFAVKEGVHGLGYRGLDPGKALAGGATRGGHFNLFTLDSDRTTSLFGPRAATRRGGVAGQVFVCVCVCVCVCGGVWRWCRGV